MSTASSGSTWIAAVLGHLPTHIFVHEVKIYGGASRIFLQALLALGPLVPGRLLFIMLEAYERARMWTLPAHSRHLGDRPELLAPANLKSFDPRSPQISHWQYDVVDSAGSHVSIAPLLRRAYPNAILCFVLRDPRDVVSSIAHRKPFGYQHTIEGWATNFVNTYSILKRYRQSCDIDVTRYEEWLADTRGQLRAFLDRHQLHMDSAALDDAVFAHDAQAIRSGKVAKAGNLAVAKAGTWKSTLSADEKQLIKPILEGTLVECGYEETTAW